MLLLSNNTGQETEKQATSQEPWDTDAGALSASLSADGAAERDLFTDRECSHTHRQRMASLHFVLFLSESVSQCVSVAAFLLHLKKYGSLWWDATEPVMVRPRRSGVRVVGGGVGEDGGELPTSNARQPVSARFLRPLSPTSNGVRRIKLNQHHELPLTHLQCSPYGA